MTTGAHGNRPTRNQQREAARAQAKAQREAMAKKEKKNKWVLQGGIVLAVLAVAAIVAIPITQAANNAAGFVRPANMETDGIVLQGPEMKAIMSPAAADGSAGTSIATAPVNGKVNIVVFQDYLCTHCNDFDRANAATLETLVNSGAATLNVHPIPWFNNDGSRRSANAAACVANFAPNSFWIFNQSIFANWTATGLSEDQLIKLANSAAPQEAEQISNCISDKKFNKFVNAANTAATAIMTAASKSVGETGVGTPTVLVNGQKYTGSNTDTKAFSAFVLKASSSSNSTSTATPAAG